MRISKTTFSIGTAALAAGVLILSAPRAAHAVVAALVQVANTTANPVITSNMDDPGRIPYASTVASICQTSNCSIRFPSVPANHRLVIQQISVVGTLSGPGVVLVTLGDIGFSAFYAPTGLVSTPRYDFAQTEPTLDFVDGENTPTILLAFFGGSGTFLGSTVGLSGYLLDCTTAPCAAIAH